MDEMEKQIAELAQNYADAEAHIEELNQEIEAKQSAYDTLRGKFDRLLDEAEEAEERANALVHVESLMEVFANPNNWDGNKFTPQETKWQIEEPYRLATRALEGNL